MTETARPREPDGEAPELPEDTLKKVEEYIEAEEGAVNRLAGPAGQFVKVVAIVMTLFHLYAAYSIVTTQVMRTVHVAFVLFLCFLVFPVSHRLRDRIRWWDVLCSLAAVFIAVYVIQGGDDFTDRNTDPTQFDIALGVVLILLILEAVRRASGWVMPAVCVMFIAYALGGHFLPPPWTHQGYDLSRLTGHLYMTLEGIYGVAVDVSSTLIILFTIYGAFLQFSGAGKFYIDFSFAAMGGKPSSAGRTVVLASFLLGGPSGSGVATTVTLGSVAYPMLKKAGYDSNSAGGLLAAGGLGAILSPPVLGAAAFLIAEFLKISYLDVILMATIPTLLYYLSIFVMVEMDTRRFGMSDVRIGEGQRVWPLVRRHGFHFLSLVSIVVFMLLGYSPVMSVFWATVVAFVTSFLASDTALISYDWFRGRLAGWRGFWDSGFVKALEGGSIGVLNVAATCAAAGIIVGIVTLTGLGLKFSAIVLQYADGGGKAMADFAVLLGASSTPDLLHSMRLFLTAVYTALIVWVVGLAVPVTASYIICAVIAAPALTKLGVPDFAAHMFIFYYAVLSEVSPPTALSPFAAAAITGGDPYKTTAQSWKYTMPAFLVPFMFVLSDSGQGLLLMGSIKKLAEAPWGDIALISATAAMGVFTMAAGLQRWLIVSATQLERWMLIVAGLLLIIPGRWSDAGGLGLIALVVVLQLPRRVRPAAA